jgi:hypothetical protein
MAQPRAQYWLPVTIAAAAAGAAALVWSAQAQTPAPVAGPASVGPLAFAADGTLFAADNNAGAIYALDLGAAAAGGAPGAKDVDGLDGKLAAMLGTGAAQIDVTDLAVHPRTHNAYVAVMRGQGPAAKPALFRIDGAGKIDLVALGGLKATKAVLADPAGGSARNRSNTVTDMAFTGGKLYVSGLSNEEFSSKFRTIPYPFGKVDKGTSLEIFHGSHGGYETRSPVYTFLPETIAGVPSLLASYICTPLVKFPVANLKPGAKVRGTTIAELGYGNRPLDMIRYEKGGHEYVLMSNTDRGVMKLDAARFAGAAPITRSVPGETAGVPYQTIATMKDVEQLDRLDADKAIVIARNDRGLNLKVLALP